MQIIEIGKWVGIRVDGKNIIGEVIKTAANHGTNDEPDWHIKIIDKKGKQQQWKQSQDGGKLAYVGDKPPTFKQQKSWK